MRGLTVLAYAVVAIASPCLGLRAQDAVIAETRVNLRRDASTERRPIRVLRALERLEVTGALGAFAFMEEMPFSIPDTDVYISLRPRVSPFAPLSTK